MNDKKYIDAFKMLYKMRIIHGSCVNKLNKISLKQKKCNKKLFNLSCLSSIISTINEKILHFEALFDKQISLEKIDPKSFEINQSESSESSESDVERIPIVTQIDEPVADLINLPLFNGGISSKQVKDDLKNFDKKIPSLILFHKPTCPACVATKPHWDNISGQFNESFNKTGKLFNILEYNVDDPSNDKLSTLFDIEYIPTIIAMESSLKPSSKTFKLTGKSEKNEILNFIKESYSKFNQ
jgi:thiol-disulfide isomerase/thioredoxin